MEQRITKSQLRGIIREAVAKTLKESGFNNYDMQQTPVTKQQQIDASWNEFNKNNQDSLEKQRKNGNVSAFLDSNINTQDFKGELGMNAQSPNKDVADMAQLVGGTPRQTAKRFDDYSRKKYGTHFKESKKGNLTMSESKLNRLIKECIAEVLKESDEFKPDGYRTVSNLGGHEVQIHPSGDSARFKFYGGEPTDWMEIEFDENGAAYVETERGKELLANYMRY